MICSGVIALSLSLSLSLSLTVLDSSDFNISSSLNGTLSNTTREVCFSILDLDDLLFEETETFSLAIEKFDVINQREDSRMLRVANSPQNITIMITDNDRDIVIGFVESDLLVEVLENTSRELCVEVMRPTVSEDLNAIIDIIVATVSGSAGIYASLSLSLSLSLSPSPSTSLYLSLYLSLSASLSASLYLSLYLLLSASLPLSLPTSNS